VVDDIVLVSEADLEEAVALLLQIEKTVVEGAGAAGLARCSPTASASSARRSAWCCAAATSIRACSPTCCCATSPARAAWPAAHHPAGPPGALYKVMKEFDAHNVNIIEIYHQRIFTTLPAKGLITDIECEARDREQIEKLVARCASAATRVSQVELN
jgi:threonine dehydratase